METPTKLPRQRREKALCCGGTKQILGLGAPEPEQTKNINDAKESGAQTMVWLCPMCIHTLSVTGDNLEMPLVFIGDLARAALGETELPI